MCGIWNWSGKDPKQFNKNKFDILGIINETRGKHSCGVSFDNMIYNGVDDQKVYRDFLSDSNDITMEQVPIAIGHTRWATGGAHNMDNAHPFGFTYDDTEEGYVFDFIGVHNGSLFAEKDLAKRYGVETTERKSEISKTGVESVSYRGKIDSEILLESIFTTNSFAPLEHYDGAAALIFYKKEEPNVTYYYHGACRFNTDSVDVTEERPLYYYRESEGSLYTSSIRQSLEMIGGCDETIGEFEHNTVYKVTDGDIDNAVTFEVNRKHKRQKQYFKAEVNALQVVEKNAFPRSYVPKNHTRPSAAPGWSASSRIRLEREVGNNLHKGHPYFHKFQMLRNGHAFTGIVVWIDKLKRFQTIVEDDCVYTAVDIFKKNYLNQYASNTTNFFTKSSVHKDSFMPFDNKNMTDEEINETFHYVIDGVMVLTSKDYVAMRNWGSRKPSKLQLSYASVHPVLDNLDDYKAKLDGALYSGDFNFFAKEKVYSFKEGKCEKVTDVKSKAALTVVSKNNSDEHFMDSWDGLVDDYDSHNQFSNTPTKQEIEALEVTNELFEKITECLKDYKEQSKIKYASSMNVVAQLAEEAVEGIESSIEDFNQFVKP